MELSKDELESLRDDHRTNETSLLNKDTPSRVQFVPSPNGNILVLKSFAKQRTIEAVSLKVVARVSNVDPWFSLDGGWGRSTYQTTFDKGEIKFSLEPARKSHFPFSTDFHVASECLKSIFKQQALGSRSVPLEGGLSATSSDFPDGRILLKHYLFLEKPEAHVDQPEQQEGSKDSADQEGQHIDTNRSPEGLDDSSETASESTSRLQIKTPIVLQELPAHQWTFDNWPLDSRSPYFADAHAELMKLKKAGTHRVNPLQAYDMNDKLISPTRYRAELVDALVEAQFTVTHWLIGGRSGKPQKHQFRLDSVKLNVLAPPPPISSPAKRPAENTDQDSPRKRLRAKAKAAGSSSTMPTK